MCIALSACKFHARTCEGWNESVTLDLSRASPLSCLLGLNLLSKTNKFRARTELIVRQRCQKNRCGCREPISFVKTRSESENNCNGEGIVLTGSVIIVVVCRLGKESACRSGKEPPDLLCARVQRVLVHCPAPSALAGFSLFTALL